MIDNPNRIPLRPDPDAMVQRAMSLVASDAVTAAKAALVSRAAVAPTKISDAGALALVQTFFLPSLIPASAAAAVLDMSLKASFDTAASISIPGISLPTSGWIGEGQAIAVVQGTTSQAALLTPSKIASIIALSNEMAGVNGQAVMEQVLRENVGASLDAAFFNSNAGTAISPPGILFGAINITPTSGGQSPMAADIGKLAQALAPVAGNNQIVIAAAPAQAIMIRGVMVDPPPVYASNALPAGTVVAIAVNAICSANGAPNIAISRETTVHVASPASELVASPSTVAAPQRSVFQTDSTALRFTMELSWAKRGAGVAMITGANWP